jgi:nucleoside-diphosphate-sugar epimerase
LSQGHEVTGLDSFNEELYPRAPKESNLQRLGESNEFTFVEKDIVTSNIFAEVQWADVIIHEAAMPGLVKSWAVFDQYSLANLTGTQRILEAIRNSPETHLVHASTSSVYGRFAVGDETLPTNPVSPYGVTKLSAEQLITAYRENYGVKATVLRYFSVYGPYQRPDMAYAKFCKLLLEGKSIQVTGDGTQSRSNTYVEDVAAATGLASEARIDGLVANICGAQNLSLNDAISIIANELDCEPKIQYVEAAAGDQVNTHGDASLAAKSLGWKPRTEIEMGLRLQTRAAKMAFDRGLPS